MTAMPTDHHCPLAFHQGLRVPILIESAGLPQINEWREYEEMKRQLPAMKPTEYEQAIREIATTLGI